MASTHSRFLSWLLALMACVIVAVAFVVSCRPPQAMSPEGGDRPQEEATPWRAHGDDAMDAIDDDGANPITYVTKQDVGSTATELVERYWKQGDCLLRQAGYLDLAGEVWGCVMEGPGWVDLCLVRQTADGSGSAVRTIRMEVQEWELDDVVDEVP